MTKKDKFKTSEAKSDLLVLKVLELFEGDTQTIFTPLGKLNAGSLKPRKATRGEDWYDKIDWHLDDAKTGAKVIGLQLRCFNTDSPFAQQIPSFHMPVRYKEKKFGNELQKILRDPDPFKFHVYAVGQGSIDKDTYEITEIKSVASWEQLAWTWNSLVGNLYLKSLLPILKFNDDETMICIPHSPIAKNEGVVTIKVTDPYRLKYSHAKGYSVLNPAKGTSHSAGADIFIPYFTSAFMEAFVEKNTKVDLFNSSHLSEETLAAFSSTNCSADSIVLLPHGRVLIPTGLYFNIPPGTYLEGMNRSGLSTKKGLVHAAHVIDEDYMGMVFASVINTSNIPITLKAGEAVLQLIHKNYIDFALADEVSFNMLFEGKDSQRGEGALGSTDQKKETLNGSR